MPGPKINPQWQKCLHLFFLLEHQDFGVATFENRYMNLSADAVLTNNDKKNKDIFIHYKKKRNFQMHVLHQSKVKE